MELSQYLKQQEGKTLGTQGAPTALRKAVFPGTEERVLAYDAMDVSSVNYNFAELLSRAEIPR